MPSALTEFRLPDVGEGLTEAEIVAWHVNVGDAVAINDVLVEVETAKSVVELPSPVAGTVTALHAEVGRTIPVGTVLVTLGASSAEEAAPLVLVGTGPSEPAVRRRRLSPRGAAAPERRAERRADGAAQPATTVDVTATVALAARLETDRRWSEPVTPQLLLTRTTALVSRRLGITSPPEAVLGPVREQAGVVDGRVVPRLVAEVSLVDNARLDPATHAALLADVVTIMRDPAEALVLAT